MTQLLSAQPVVPFDEHLPSSGCVLGLDVGYSTTHSTTGICLFSWSETEIVWKLRNTGSTAAAREADLRDLIPKNTMILGVGIDGPLVPGLRSATGYRCADALFCNGKFQNRGSAAPTRSDSPLHVHATALAKLLKNGRDSFWSLAEACHHDPIDSLRIVEAHPVGFLSTLVDEPAFPDRVGRGKASDLFFAYAAARGVLSRMIADLLPERTCFEHPFRITDHDERAAFSCALTALFVVAGQFVMAGDPQDGSICIAPTKYWGKTAIECPEPWAVSELRTNLRTIVSAPARKSKLKHAAACRIFENGSNWS